MPSPTGKVAYVGTGLVLLLALLAYRLSRPIGEPAAVDRSTIHTDFVKRGMPKRWNNSTPVLFVSAPAHARGHSTFELFKIVDKGKSAVRVPVCFGRLSGGVIEVLDGVSAGDEIILSDTSAYDNFSRIEVR